MASFIGDDETVWNEGRIKGFENGSSGTYGFLSAVTWSSRTLIAKGIKTEVFGAKVAEAIRDREFKRLELANGLAGCAPEVRGTMVIFCTGAEWLCRAATMAWPTSW